LFLFFKVLSDFIEEEVVNFIRKTKQALKAHLSAKVVTKKRQTGCRHP